MSFKIHSLMLVCFFVLLSCSDDTMPSPQDSNLSRAMNMNSSAELTAIDNYIHKNHPMKSRTESVTLKPYVFNGDTVMFIADYGNKQGWEVFSNTTSAPMVLVKSEEGSFDDISENPAHPIHGILTNCAQKIWETKNSNSGEVSPVNSEWKLYNKDLNTYANSATANTYDIGEGYENYQFILSSDVTTTKNVYEPKGGRLKTKWGQGSYFNLYTPFYEDDADRHTFVGCVPVAFGQFLYHSHYNFGEPVYTVTDAAYDSSKNTYSFSGMSSTIWDSFNTDLYWNFFPNDMKPTAVFLGYIGVSIGVHYGKRYNYPNEEDKHDGSGSNIINRKCVDFFENQTNLNVDVVDLEEKYVISNLKKGYPIVAQVLFVNDSDGHAFLIDHCDTEMTSFYNYYTPTILPPDAEWPDVPADITLDELKALFGEIIVEEVISTKVFYQMNWGFYGKDDNLKIDRWCVEWVVNKYVFDRTTAEMYNIK